MQRISRLKMYSQILRTVAQRSTCSKPNAALLVKESRIISMGYNGSPKDQPHCLEAGCIQGPDGGCIRTIHAEQNAIAFAAKHGISTDGATLYTTSSPCYSCAKLIINSGVIEVIYLDLYRDTEGIDLLTESGITIRQEGDES
jgi:dCMP deaminase